MAANASIYIYMSKKTLGVGGGKWSLNAVKFASRAVFRISDAPDKINELYLT